MEDQGRPIVNPCHYHPEEECIPTQPHCHGCNHAPDLTEKEAFRAHVPTLLFKKLNEGEVDD